MNAMRVLNDTHKYTQRSAPMLYSLTHSTSKVGSSPPFPSFVLVYAIGSSCRRNAFSARARTVSNPSLPRLVFCMIVSADHSSILFERRWMYVNAMILECDRKRVWEGEVGAGVYVQVSLIRRILAHVRLTDFRTTVCVFGSTSLTSRTYEIPFPPVSRRIHAGTFCRQVMRRSVRSTPELGSTSRFKVSTAITCSQLWF